MMIVYFVSILLSIGLIGYGLVGLILGFARTLKRKTYPQQEEDLELPDYEDPLEEKFKQLKKEVSYHE